MRQLMNSLPGSAPPSPVAMAAHTAIPASTRPGGEDAVALNHMLSFDGTEGVLTCEAGALLSDVIDALLPRGWFPPVTPGTKFVTIGGLIAADVHGKNHHVAGLLLRPCFSLDLCLPTARS